MLLLSVGLVLLAFVSGFIVGGHIAFDMVRKYETTDSITPPPDDPEWQRAIVETVKNAQRRGMLH